MGNLLLPEIQFPGIISVKASVDCFVHKEKDAVVINANCFQVESGAGAVSFEDARRRVKFDNHTVLSYIAEPGKHELKMDSDIKLAFDPPGPMRALMPVFVWETVGMQV